MVDKMSVKFLNFNLYIMEFIKGELFHIYNRGNNRDRIFYSRRNYLFFLEKIKTYISPYGEVIAWCLMPNHFHLMVYINEIDLIVPITDPLANSERVVVKKRTLNQSIGIMLRSYTNAIQKQEGRTGALFQEETKAVLLADSVSFSPSYFNTAFGTFINVFHDDKSYAENCFNYIHLNPVSSNIVKRAEDWEFSSFRDYIGIRDGILVNKERGNEFFNCSSLI